MAYVEENILSDEDEIDWSAPLLAGPEDAVQGYETSSTQSSGASTKKGGGYSDSNRQNLTSTYKGMSSPGTREGQVNKGLVSRMQLNDYKAGMQGLDRERINKIIYEASKGSRFYENEMKKEAQMTARVEEMQRRLTLLTSEQMQAGEQEADQILQTLEAGRDMSRTIVHVDMDMFYAAVEMKDDPALQHVPMAVGSNSMLSTSNYIARRFGVRAAMPGFIGRKLCPDLVIVPTNFEKYTAVSKQIRAVMADYDPNFSPMSLDEAFLDMTSHLEKRAAFGEDERTFQTMLTLEELCRCDTAGAPSVDSGGGVGVDSGDPIKDRAEGAPSTNMADKQTTCNVCGKQRCAAQGKVETFGMSAEEAVREMRARIHWETKLTASAGIAPNTMLAKVCSDQNKPNGQYYMPSSRDAVLDFVSKLDIRKVSGIGKVATQLLRSVGVNTCSDLFTRRGVLRHLYSEVSFNYFLRISAGIGSTRVERDGERKSMSVERTFSEIREPKELYQKCHELCESLAEDLNDEQIVGKTVGIKLKTVNFRLMTRAQTLLNATCDTQQIYGAACELLRTEILHCQPDPLRLRLMGVRMSNLMPKNLVGEQKQCTIKSLLLKMKSKPPRVQTTSVAPPILESISVAPPILESISVAPPSLEASTVALLTSVRPPCLGFDSVVPPSPKSTSVVPPSPVPHPDEISSISSCTINSHAKQIPISKDGGSKLQGTTLWKRTGNLPNKKKTFVCPICSKDIADSNLNQFNRHIDECLVRNPQDLATLSDDVTERVETVDNVTEWVETIDTISKLDIESISKSTELELMALKIEDKEQSESKVKSVSRVDMPSHEEQQVKSQTNNTLGQLTVKIDDSEARCSLDASQIDHQKHCEKTGIDDVMETPGGSKLDVTSAVQPILDALFCPICNRRQDTYDLTVFNKHVDECLNQGLLLSDDQCFKSASKTSAALKRTPKSSGRTKKRTLMASRVKRSGTKAAECGGPSNAGVTSSESSRRTPGEKNENLVMTCPVCDLSQEWTSQDAFSRHVDSCLNRAAIRDLLHGDTSSQNKRPSTHLPDEPTSKRKKCIAKGVQRIDSFFNN